jgi:hypothetical protein
VGLVIWDQTKKRSLLQLEGLKRKQGVEQRWKSILAEIDSSNSQTVSESLEKAKDERYKTLDDAFGLSSRAMPLRDLSKILTETHGVSGDQVKTLVSFLEFTEMVRFSSGATFSTGEEAVKVSRERVESVQKICLDLQRNPLEKQA